MADLKVCTINIRETTDCNSKDESTIPTVSIKIACNGIELDEGLPSLVVHDDGFRELLRWYLEDFAVHDPFQTTKATRVSLKMKAYTSALQAALQLDNVVPFPEGITRIIIRVHESEEDSTAYRSILWEALEHVESIRGFPQLSILSTIRVVQRAKQVQVNAEYWPKFTANIPHYNILAMSARPRLVEDIHHRLITRPLHDICEQIKFSSDTKITFEIIRPATLEALITRLSTNLPTDYNVLHLDVHGVLNQLGPCLSFIQGTSESLQENLVPFETLLPSLTHANLSLVVLNSCQSAVNGQTPNANIARRLAEYGIPAVVAMSYKVLDTAAAIFTQFLYFNLLYEACSISDAVHSARQSLIADPNRPTKFGTTVSVDDFIVPVVYQSSEFSEHSVLPMIAPKAMANDISMRTTFADGMAFIGREEDILILESHLLLHTPAFQLIGELGVVHPMEPTLNKERDIMDRLTLQSLAKADLLVDQHDQSKRILVILDGFGTPKTAREKTEQKEVEALVRQLLNLNFFVVTVSRQLELWLRFQMNLSHRLFPLRDAEALTLGTYIVKHTGLQTESMENRDLPALGHLIRLADGNPLALKLLLHSYLNQRIDPALEAVEYHKHLLKGGHMDYEDIWIREMSGSDAVLELQELFAPVSRSGEVRPLNPEFLLPFWSLLPSEDLTMYWLLTTWDWTPFQFRRRLEGMSRDYSHLGILKDLTDGRLLIVTDQYPGFKKSPEYIKMITQVKDLLKLFVEHHFIEQSFNFDFSADGQTVQMEYHRLHPLVPLVVRQYQKTEHKHIAETCGRIVPIFYNYRMRSWPLQVHYTETVWNLPKCILGHEFLNFLAAAYFILELPPNLVNTSSLFWIISVINKSALADTSRMLLLAEFWRSTVTKVMPDKEIYLNTRSAGDDADLDKTLILPGPSLMLDELTKLKFSAPLTSVPFLVRQALRFVIRRLPSVILELAALQSLSILRNYQSTENPGSTAVYLSLMEKVYKNRTVIPLVDFRIKASMDYMIQPVRNIEMLRSLRETAEAVVLQNQQTEEPHPGLEEDASTVSQDLLESTRQFGMSRLGMGNSMASSIEPLVVAQLASEEALDTGDTKRAKQILEDALLTEMASHPSAYNTARLYQCLSNVAEKEEDYFLALQHERKGWEVEMSAGMEKTPPQVKLFERRMDKLTMLANRGTCGKSS